MGLNSYGRIRLKKLLFDSSKDFSEKKDKKIRKKFLNFLIKNALVPMVEWRFCFGNIPLTNRLHVGEILHY